MRSLREQPLPPDQAVPSGATDGVHVIGIGSAPSSDESGVDPSTTADSGRAVGSPGTSPESRRLSVNCPRRTTIAGPGPWLGCTPPRATATTDRPGRRLRNQRSDSPGGSQVAQALPAGPLGSNTYRLKRVNAAASGLRAASGVRWPASGSRSGRPTPCGRLRSSTPFAYDPAQVAAAAAAMREAEPRCEVLVWPGACAELRAGEALGLTRTCVGWTKTVSYMVTDLFGLASARLKKGSGRSR
jgi:hypothetical protein